MGALQLVGINEYMLRINIYDKELCDIAKQNGYTIDLITISGMGTSNNPLDYHISSLEVKIKFIRIKFNNVFCVITISGLKSKPFVKEYHNSA